MSMPVEFHYRIPRRLGAWRPGSHPATTLGAGQEFVSHMSLYDRPDPRRLDLRASLRDVRNDWLIRVNRQRAAVAVQVIVDVSASMVKMAARRNRKAVEQGLASVRLIDGSNLGLSPRSFDHAFSVHTLYFWKNPPEILRQLRESLREQGRLVLAFRVEGADIPERFRDPTYRFYTEDEVEQLLREAGFAEIQLVRAQHAKGVVHAVASVPAD